MVAVLLVNFFCLLTARLRPMIYAVALQGILLGAAYPIAHQGVHLHEGTSATADPFDFARVMVLTLSLIGIKGFVIPQLIFRALREVHVEWTVETLVGFIPSLLIGAIGTGLALEFAGTLPVRSEHNSLLIVPTSLATVFCGFLLLVTRRKFITQVLGYIVLENGIFIFGLLLVEAMPMLVEVGVLLDLFVGVFVMGILIYHVSREFPSASSEHISALRE
jgi:hydrogenase-4 component E